MKNIFFKTCLLLLITPMMLFANPIAVNIELNNYVIGLGIFLALTIETLLLMWLMKEFKPHLIKFGITWLTTTISTWILYFFLHILLIEKIGFILTAIIGEAFVISIEALLIYYFITKSIFNSNDQKYISKGSVIKKSILINFTSIIIGSIFLGLYFIFIESTN